MSDFLTQYLQERKYLEQYERENGTRQALSLAADHIVRLRMQLGILERPTIVTLCGSTRFWQEFQKAGLQETLAGKLVFSIGAATGSDDEHFGYLPLAERYELIKSLDELHLRKIELSDEILVLNVGGYIGESTAREIAHATKLGKKVRYLESTDAS